MHYEGLSTPALIKSWREREYYKGRVRLWDTESWMANTDDRYLAMVAATRAAGYDRVMGSLVRVAISDRSHGRVFHDRIHTEQGVEKVVRPLESRPLAAVYSASQHFIGDRSFREILFHHGLPWVFVFEGLESNPDDGTVVVVGDLSEVFHRVADKLLLSTVRSAKEVAGERGITEQLLKLAGDEKAKRRQLLQEFREDQFFEGAKLTIDAGEGAFQLYDYYGNAVPSSGDTIEIPLAGQGYFLRADPDKPGSFERLIEALREARVEGIEPAEIIPHDMTEPIDREPTLRLRMTNVLERPVSGKLTVKLGGLEVSHPQELTLTPRRQTWVDVKVTGGEARADNTYPLSVVFEAGRDGRAVHHEDMHVNWVSRRTIAVDGKLDDWRGVLPQSIVPGESGGATLTEQMWLPFEKLDADAEPGAAIGYVAHDDEYFYFAAKIVDSSKHPGTVRFAERDEDAAFYPEISYAKKKRSAELEAWHWPEGVRRFSYRRSPLLPSGPPWFDNVMIGFNALPLGEDPKQLATLPGIPMRFTGYDSIDYEYALNPVAEEYGGGTEIWRMQTPKLPRKHYYPRQPEHPAEGPVTEGKLKIWYEGNLRFVEAAIPWSELPHVKRKRDAGRTVKFSYRVNDDGGKFQDLGMGRSVIEGVGHSFHPDWRGGNHVLLDFGFER